MDSSDFNVHDSFSDSSEMYHLGQLESFLRAYKLSQYLEAFVSEGFDRLLSLFDITESDLISLHVKRGHRRLLQRAIATARGVPIATPIMINYGHPYYSDVSPNTPEPSNQMDYFNDDEGYKSPRKNNFRRRRQYVPSKPITPFDELLNEVKSDQRYQGLHLPDLVSIAHERWSNFSGLEKEKYEREALHANSDYVMDGMSRQRSDSDM